ncbi:guanine nucleotide binding protein, alpha subunit [Mycena albidolilacea]|uniref:Guanine nucleotide binding protein, alpha subunit n=1 Tax=Mycena albidolilacea TaxID=1033008 RepID=A0AAD7EGJ5_9AGAR|nr:guanine nucleotide binding protein, alpha subunit [Mycena albidolilacea]
MLHNDDPLDAVLRPPPDETQEEAAVREAREMEARRVSAQIDADIKAERQARRKKRIVRLLLLGQSESGKSTTLRQFQRLYTPTAFREERILWRAVIQLNIVRSIRTILYALDPTSSTSPPRRRSPSSIMALAGPSAPPQPGTSADAYNYDNYYAGYNNNYASASGYASDGAVDSDPESDPGPSSQSRFNFDPAPEWEALRARLLPLQHVEALLIARLVPPNEDEPTRLDFGGGLPPGAEVMKEIFVRPGNRWKASEHQKSPANSRSHSRSHSHGSDRDEAQEALTACAPAMMALWADPGVRAVLRRRKVRLEEGPGFFLNDLERVTAPNYLPTDDDVLRARLKTVGVSEYTFEMEVSTGRETGTEWRIVDVGGTTWVPFFDDVDAIIFLAPIAGFDQVLAEDRTVNRLEDSVLLWKAVCSNKLLAGVDLVLFLNKCDILERKLAAGVQLVRYVRSYAERENTFAAVSQYLRGKFSAIHREYSPNPRKFYAFCTSVTDTATTAGIIASVRDMVVRQHLKQSKLL